MIDVIYDLSENLRAACSYDDIQRVGETTFQRLGFETFAYVGFPSDTDPYTINNHPSRWRRRYLEASYLEVDPTIARSADRILPFTWNSITPGPVGRAAQMFDEAKEFGLSAGVTIPAHAFGKDMGVIFLATPTTSTDFEKLWSDRQHVAHIATIHLNAACFEELRKSISVPTITLSGREKECLLWSFRGKTAWEVSAILNISKRTVTFHLTNAARKLQASSKQHAVIKALLRGLISP